MSKRIPLISYPVLHSISKSPSLSHCRYDRHPERTAETNRRKKSLRSRRLSYWRHPSRSVIVAIYQCTRSDLIIKTMVSDCRRYSHQVCFGEVRPVISNAVALIIRLRKQVSKCNWFLYFSTDLLRRRSWAASQERCSARTFYRVNGNLNWYFARAINKCVS